MVVKVGTGGEANLKSHRNGSKHHDAMSKLVQDESAKKFRAFFSTPRPPAQPVLVAPRLSRPLIESTNVEDALLESTHPDIPVTSPLFAQLKDTIA